MSDDPPETGAESIEGRSTIELVRDEDVLSLDAQRALEGVGTALGVIAAIALLASQLPRAARLLCAIHQPTGAPAARGAEAQGEMQ